MALNTIKQTLKFEGLIILDTGEKSFMQDEMSLLVVEKSVQYAR